MKSINKSGFITAAVSGLALSLLPLPYSAVAADNTTAEQSVSLDKSVMDTLKECQKISTSCSANTKNAPGVLVFPNVIKADLIVGGAGGKGALVENGKITDYYSIGAASAGLQAGVESTSQVYVFRTPAALEKLKKDPDWKVGASAGVTLITADANATSSTGDVLAYVFDAKGLSAGISLDVFDIWKTKEKRPRTS